MSHTELHELESARAYHPAVPAARVAATIAEVALVLLVVGVWLVTCLAG
ncbi:MAG TPA: hypothetical protein VKF60_17445 [Myxococcota bacterium]|nr:hypothetical protein [Myxococcota bacterium]